MPFDAVFLSAVLEELRPSLLGARVEKIQQPSRDTVLLTLRGKEKLLLSANVNRPRIHLTAASFDNPAQPPMFCMLLRKHLSGGRISALTQPTAERVVELTLECTDEMGVPCQKHLILELMGRNSNLILTDPEGRILDCFRRVDFEMSAQRQVLPGLFYRNPPAQDKRIPWQTDAQMLSGLLAQVQSPKMLDQWLLDSFSGLSPLVARELCFGFCGETQADILSLNRDALTDYLSRELSFCAEKRPVLLLAEDGRPRDFSYRPILQYGSFPETRQMESFSALLDAFYTETDRSDRIRQKAQSLRRAVSNLHERTLRKLEVQKKELEATYDRERLRRMGDIVMANLHAIQRGQCRLEAVDFYDEEMKTVEIPLKPELSPQQNAAKYYKDYTKAKNAEIMLTGQLAHGRQEADYLAGVLEELSRAESEADLNEIRLELEEGGYVRPAEKRKAQKPAVSRPMRFCSSLGFSILVGRNNRQNDLLSLKTARRDDLWLHVQKFHGAHVIIECAGQEVPDETVTEAAMLAAWYSGARQGQNVPVDVTPVRFLKKPGGAKPGMLVYEKYRTVFVTPNADLPPRLAGTDA